MERLEKLRTTLKETQEETLRHLGNGCKCPTLTELVLWQEEVDGVKTLPSDIRLVKGVTGIQACLSLTEMAFRLYAEGADVQDALAALERVAADPSAVRVPYVSREYKNRETRKHRGKG
jgi:hypothetical protein